MSRLEGTSVYTQCTTIWSYAAISILTTYDMHLLTCRAAQSQKSPLAIETLHQMLTASLLAAEEAANYFAEMNKALVRTKLSPSCTMLILLFIVSSF